MEKSMVDWNQAAPIITAIGTLALAIVASVSLRVVKKQMALLNKQAVAMEVQSSLMLENMEYDRLVKKYERVNREISLLIGPLYSRRNDANIFSLNKRAERIFLSPTSSVRDPTPNALIYDFVSFWDSIEQNMCLNTSSVFELDYRDYSRHITDNIEKLERSTDENKKKGREDDFNKTKKLRFIKEIEERYKELSNELKDLESKLSKKKD